ncbi:MAG: hypothetical protein Q7S04_04200 [Candidatus Moranbacteria bacterium]|nr:hypothetical protein [Candidatus Moranbacteria bacterium]
MAEENTGGSVGKVIIIVVVVAIVAVGVLFLKKGKDTTSVVVDSSKYQAVFLSNGQTYFGKVVSPNEKYVSLTDVYYLVLKQPLQNQKNENTDQNQEQAKPEYSLIKLGKEMHGPTSMSINKDQILFIENLADDSKVVTAIKTPQK